ncbi:electron transfer flavoprotein subunit beta/FixA family protein [Paeniglutamicibacter sp. ZC-3]|uniref:electron transfer flavoprotein subunit beta/FixA family protein n=1 Tax=Paeniglutamicibacter sp. ZC-3 TaxID=2986919 RepID=UPI0021F71FCB|nr:electron transfer flavoprotein subunit beta/FixA family protein [Paeniglutamicibacter sp. ZC-3]MCV9995438.1 electron transfer flavoprotein subunit beta/FixA family protein [Paeniglutamicibacter sp. ZC-3]
MSQNTGTPLNILVLVKHVPDVQFERQLTGPGNRLDRKDSVLSELDEYAIEAALALSESRGGEKAGNTVTAMTMGPDAAANAVKKSLQMGAAKGVHISDPALAGSDAGATSLVLATAIKQLGGFDVVLTGMASTDAETSLVPAQLAERLGIAQLTNLSKVELDPGSNTVTAVREGEDGAQTLEAGLPVLLSVTDQANEPRYPNFRGILAAKKKKVTTLTLAELGLAESAVGAAGSATRVLGADPRPPRAAGEIITDSGQAGIALVDFLADAKLI